MAASLVLAGREANNNERDCRDAVLAFARQYREAMGEFAKMPAIDLARYQVFRQVRVSPVVSVLSKAERATPMHNLEKLTEYRRGQHHFRDQKPLQYHVSRQLADEVIASLRNYQTTLLPERRHFFAQYRAVDVSFRAVGTGSVGVRDYIVLMFAGAIDDPLFMQVKEEIPSAYALYLPRTRIPMHEGQRVAEGGRAMQVQSDSFLGWTSIEGRDFLVRQLRDHNASIEDEDLEGGGLVQYARVCGEVVERTCAIGRSGCVVRISGQQRQVRQGDGEIWRCLRRSDRERRSGTGASGSQWPSSCDFDRGHGTEIHAIQSQEFKDGETKGW